MKWAGRRESDNVEDRRGRPVGRMAVGGGVGMLLLMLVVYLAGGNPLAVLQQVQQQGGGQAQQAGPDEGQDDEAKQFVSVVLADTEDVWKELFRRHLRREYPEPTLVLFTGQVQSRCGIAGSAVGPFYCPGDQQVYLDLSFFDELRSKFKAPGDFAAAYVIAHEVGHHVQNTLGIMDQVEDLRGRMGAPKNESSVRLELQADFLAGVWAHHAQQAKGFLEPGDLEEALTAANAIGDDKLQQQGQGYVRPDSFTHGTSAQRVRWFRRGFDTGDLSLMDELFKLPYERL
ncbi:MAG: neutral zinc metallopeptidase [Pirellulales bacterium]